MQQPTIGRIVHYHQQEVVGTITSHGPVTRTYAAIITEVLPRDHGEENAQDQSPRTVVLDGDAPHPTPRVTRAMRLAAAEEAQVPRVSLRVFYPDNDRSITGVPFSDEIQGNHWTWPPRT